MPACHSMATAYARRITSHPVAPFYYMIYNELYNPHAPRAAPNMIEDVVKELGHLTLGTRLKRLGERLQAQTQVLLEHDGVTLPASHFPVLAALDRLGPLSVGELTEAVGISQPGVTRLLDKLETEGLVRSTQSAGDRRVRTIALTKSGSRLISRSKRTAWPLLEAAVADACAGPAQPLLAILTALEGALAEAPLSVRAERLRSNSREDRREPA
jgi:DNA-binding MarR family transcriptional regulator